MTETERTIAGYTGASVPSSARYQWMDLSRGLGVLLIVLVHAGSIYGSRSGAGVPDWIRSLDLLLAPYRVPLLIFLSGILLSRSLAKGSERFISGKVKNLAWPYVIWTAIFVLAAAEPAGLLRLSPWVGGTTLWYLSFLFVYFAIGLLFARVPYLVIAAYALSLAMVMPEESKWGSRVFLLMSYFFVGAWGGQHLDRFTAAIRSKWILALFPLLVALSIYSMHDPSFKYSPYVAPLVIALIVSMCGVFNMVAGGRLAAAFQFVGRNSLVYYVVHPPIYFVVYDAMFSWGVRSPYWCIGIALLLGVLAPTILVHLKQRSTAVSLLFQGPDFRLAPALRQITQLFDRFLLPPRPAPAGAISSEPQSFDQSR